MVRTPRGRMPGRALPLVSVLAASTLLAISAFEALASVGGTRITCTDFRTQLPVDVYAQRVLGDGSIAQNWASSSPALCAGTDRQFAFAAASDGSGGAIVAWVEETPDGADLFVQRLTAAGTPAAGWPAGAVPLCTAARDQYAPRIVSDGAGGAIVCWQDYRSSRSAIYALRLASDGSRASGWTEGGIVVSAGAAEEVGPAMATDGAGGAIIAWQDFRGGASAVYALRITGAGAPAQGWSPDGVRLAASAASQSSPAIAGDGAGGAFVVWEEARAGRGVDLLAQHLDAAGGIAGGWNAGGAIVCGATGDQRFASVLGDGAGGILVAWHDTRSDDGDVYVQRVAGAGGSAPGWPADGLAVCTAAGQQYGPSAAGDGAGGAIVAWEDYRTGGEGDIYAGRLAADGASPAGWSPDGNVMCDDGGAQSAPTVQASNGGALVSWVDARASGHAHLFRATAPRTELPALESVEVGERLARLAWRTRGAGLAVTLERAVADEDWRAVATAVSDAAGRIAFQDPAPENARRLRYRLAIGSGSRAVRTAEVTVDIPLRFALALHGLSPSPARDQLRVSFSLPDRAPATLELLDIAGRKLDSRAVGGLGGGHHVVTIAERLHVPPGIYLLRLSQSGRSLTTTASVLR